MGRINETISTVNSAIRTFLALAIVGVLATLSWVIYERITEADRALNDAREQVAATQSRLLEAEETITDLRDDVAKKQQQIDRLETAMTLLKTDTRLAQVEVLEQTLADDAEHPTTRIRFTELSPNGTPIGEAREFDIEGDVVYIDNWVVKFDDEYVEQADLARGTSLALFRRVFGEYQSPADAALIDEVGVMPQAYVRGGSPSEFEQEIWSDFWTFANDREAAREKGIRAAHGEALSMKVEKGRTYRVVLRASDGLSIIAEPSSNSDEAAKSEQDEAPADQL